MNRRRIGKIFRRLLRLVCRRVLFKIEMQISKPLFKRIRQSRQNKVSQSLSKRIKQSWKKMLRDNACSLLLLEITGSYKEAIMKAKEYRTQFKERCINTGYNKAQEKKKNLCYYNKNHQYILTNQRKKTACPHCNLMVRSYYLKKHLLTSKCKNTFFHYELNENISRSGINPFQILPRYMTYDVVKNTLIADTRIYKLRKCQFKTMCRILEERALEFIRFTL